MRAALISKIAITVVLATATSVSITTTAGATPVAEGSSAAALRSGADTATADAARTAAFAHAAETGLTAQSGLVVTEVMADQSGKQHVRFAQTYRNLPVVGADLVVHLTAASEYLGVTRASDTEVSVPTVSAKVTAEQARAKAASVVPKGASETPHLIVHTQNGKTVLAYQVQVASNDDVTASHVVVVDASTGDVVSDTPALDGIISPKLESKLKGLSAQASASGSGQKASQGAKPGSKYPLPAVGTGASMYSGTVTLNTSQTSASAYTLVDTTRGKAEVRNARNTILSDSRVVSGSAAMTDADNAWGNGTTSDVNTAGVDAQYGLTSTFDFYKNTLGRNGIRNDGVGPVGVVHFAQNYGNAGWSNGCWCMVYGDGDGYTFTKPLTQLDVTGHELTHGVVSATAALQTDYSPSGDEQIGEPGSLNESLADIFGTAVEFSTNNATHAPNYLMGEQLGLSQGFLRRMDRPSLDVLEGAVDYWSPNAPQTEVHGGSGVSSHAFFLLAEGSGARTINGVAYNSPTYDGSTLTGIGRDKAVAIFYQALTRYMVSSTDFHDARTATLQAAADLYGQGSTEYTTVDKAWAAVNVTASNG
ncbi:M4 family metallopeptidase [Peterkaempfera griseoplana]|uniref:M4 family metallopeptidase n=1 Tax=Peterkaempfera griseoplana TaxID=66896 RepID=UPI0006E13C65|nr:M4 family metallopeptidase [Peterkaempfera griseoplana]